MNKKYLPSLIIFAKGMMVTAIGLFFTYTNKPGANVVLIAGGCIILAALVVLVIMSMITKKNDTRP